MAPSRYEGLGVSLQGRTDDDWLVTFSDFGRDWPYQVGVAFQDTTRFGVLPELDAREHLDHAAPFGGLQPPLKLPARRVYGIQAPTTMTANSPLWEPQPQYTTDALGHLHVTRGSPYVIETWVLDGTGARLVRRLTRERRSLPHADAVPALGRIHAGRDGSIWVERPDLVEDPVTLEWSRGAPQPTYWDVFDGDGRFIGTVELPAGFRVYDVTANAVVGVVRDEPDVEHVVRWVVDR